MAINMDEFREQLDRVMKETENVHYNKNPLKDMDDDEEDDIE